MTELTNTITGALVAHLPLQLPQQAREVREEEEQLQPEAQGRRATVRLLSAEVSQEVPLGQQSQRGLRDGVQQ